MRALRGVVDHWPIWIALLLNALGGWYVYRDGKVTPDLKVSFTSGDVQAVHAPVTLAGEAVTHVSRLAPGEAVETGADGRARVRLDDGTTIVLDRNARLVADARGPKIEKGRAFVQGVEGSRSTVLVADVPVSIGGASVAVEAEKKSVYCAAGEAVVQKDGEKRVHAGETAVLGAEVKVAPEKAFLDWTYGMAAPWGALGKPRAAIGELWGKLSNVPTDEIGSPLAVRAHTVDAAVDGEVAVTRVSTTYFNAGNGRVTGDFRMMLPESAIVSRFAEESGGSVREGRVGLAKEGGPDGPKLEWAGEGIVRATTSPLDAGQTMTIVVEYVEWLQKRGDKVTYRYPMVGEGKAPLLGEFRARIDASASTPVGIRAPQGADVSGGVVELSKADLRPTSDLVVELSLRPHALGAARAYVAEPPSGDPGGAYVFVRTETRNAPQKKGATLAVVVDTSLSTTPAQLDAARGLVEAVLHGLGSEDRVVVLAADQGVRPVGPKTLGPVDDARRKEVAAALGALVPEGATDLGAALERAADLLPDDAPEGMVLYVGDGWPTVGDLSMDRIRARLARRRGGVPRLGAVAVGPLANRFGLSALVRGSGPVLELGDRTAAPETATHLFAEALRPAVAGADLDLGPNVDRVYPRGARTVSAGSSLTAAGRLRGPLPGSIKVRSKGDKGESRTLTLRSLPRVEDVRRRWAAARVEELALRGEGRESTVDAALRTGLLTPWTGWVIGPQTYVPTPIESRVLDLSPLRPAAFSARLATPPSAFGALAEPLDPGRDRASDADYERAVLAAARRTIDEAMGSVRACRDSRAALRPELTGTLRINFRLAGDGTPKKVAVKSLSPRDDDPALDRCVELVVGGLTFFDAGGTTEITVTHDLRLPPPREARGRTCSPASTLPLGARRGVWRERMKRDATATAFVSAKLSCELPTWADRRALLEVLMDLVPQGTKRVDLARALDDLGEAEAAEVVRREALRRATSPDELYRMRFQLLGDEKLAVSAFRKKYADAHGNDERLAVVRRFLRLAPHDGTLLRRLLALLETMGDKIALTAEIARIRQDPFADAAVLADGAAALLHLGDADGARRAFGELIERAPTDPFSHAFLGDRLRAEGLFDDASRAYATLADFSPGDPGAALRLALAHAGAGRLDVASRKLSEVAQTGGAEADAKLALLAGVLDGVLLAAAKEKAKDADRALLARRELELALPEGKSFVLVRRLAHEPSVEASILRGPKEDLEAPADAASPTLGLFALRVERGDKRVTVRLRATPTLPPHKATKVRVDVLREGGVVVTKEVELSTDGKPTDLHWTGTAFE